MTIVLEGEDRQTILDTIAWFSEQAYLKFSKGVQEHGGVLIRKASLVREAELETLDHVIYLRAIRTQLEAILDCLNRGEVDVARESLRLMLRGNISQTLPAVE